MNLKIKKAFTLIEVIIATVIISIGIIGIISVINQGQDFMERTRQDIIAINLAREGIEGVFNIRDTNWLRWGGKKDICWLKQNPFNDGGDDNCGNDPWILSGNYILSGETIQDQQYFVLSGINQDLDISSMGTEDREYIMCMNNGYWYNCPGGPGYIKEGGFYRQIKGLGLYDKNQNSSNVSIICNNGEDGTCGDDSAKEFRFCSITQYSSKSGHGEVKLCSVLTNFEK